MPTRSSSLLNNSAVGIEREIGSQYDVIKEVSLHLDSIEAVASEDLQALTNALNEAKDFTGISVVAGVVAAWDPVNKVITVPTVKGDTGEAGSDGVDGAVGPQGPQGVRGPVGLTGPQGPQGVKGDTGLQGQKGDKGDKGDTGDSLGIASITDNLDGTYTWEFTDGTTYVTGSLKGAKGDTGSQGPKGEQGLSVHHSKGTSTTNPLGDFGVVGHRDTYTLYADAGETLNIGSFVVQNAANDEQVLELVAEVTTALGVPDGIATLDSNGDLVFDQLPAISKAYVGLGDVDNTSDANKPVSSLQRSAILDAVPTKSASESYGLVWNETADTYSRVGDSDYTRIQSKLRRCVLDESAQVKYYLHPNNSNLKMDGTPAVLDGSDGDVMVEVPLTYMKYTYGTTGSVTHSWEINDVEEDGFEPHPCFVRAGEVVKYRYYPAYEGKIIAGRLRSVSGQYPTTSTTRAAFRDAAKANGANYHQLDWLLYEFITLLCIIEYGTMNIQAALGQGRTALTGGSWVGGSLIGITGLSNQYGNSSANYTFAGDAGATDADSSFMSYRGCENFFGNVWKFVDGINIQNYVPYVNDNHRTFDDDVFTGDYKSAGVTMAAASGYTRTLHNSSKGFFTKSISGGSSSAGTTDYYYQASGNRIALVGGDAGNGLYAGPLYLRASNVASYVDVHVGGALSA